MDIIKLIGEYVNLTKRGRNYIGICPFHSDSRPSLTVSPVKMIFKCFVLYVAKVVMFLNLFLNLKIFHINKLVFF